MNQCRQGWLANTPSSSFCLPSKPRSYGLASRRASDWHARAWRVGCVAEAPFGADKTPTLDKPPTPAASLTGSLTLQQRGVSRHHHPRRHPRHTLFRLCKVILTSDQNVRVQPPERARAAATLNTSCSCCYPFLSRVFSCVSPPKNVGWRGRLVHLTMLLPVDGSRPSRKRESWGFVDGIRGRPT